MLEETRHFVQNKTGMNDDKPMVVRTVLNEIDVKRYLLDNQKRYNIPRAEIEETKEQLEYYENQLKKLKEQGHV